MVGDRVLIPDCPDNCLLDVKPEIIPALSVYGQGEDLGNLGGCQCKFKLPRIILLLMGNGRNGFIMIMIRNLTDSIGRITFTAEFVRVPVADKSMIILGEEHDHIEDKDFLVLTDIFPAAWIGVTWSDFEAGNMSSVTSRSGSKPQRPLAPFRLSLLKANHPHKSLPGNWTVSNAPWILLKRNV